MLWFCEDKLEAERIVLSLLPAGDCSVPLGKACLPKFLLDVRGGEGVNATLCPWEEVRGGINDGAADACCCGD